MHRTGCRPPGRLLGRALLACLTVACLGGGAAAQVGFAPGDPPLPAAAAAAWTEAVDALAVAVAAPRPWTPDAPAWRTALVSVRQAVEAAPGHPVPLRTSLRTHVAVGWWVRAVAAVDALQAARPDDPWAETEPRVPATSGTLLEVATEALREYGFARYQADDAEAALATFARWAELVPDDPDARRWLGRVLLERGDPIAALPHLRRWAALRPDDPDAAYFVAEAELGARVGVVASGAFRRGLASYEAGDLEAAARAFAEARDAAPEYADAHAWAGRLALEAGDPAAAVAAFAEALALRPDDAGLAYFLRAAELERDFGVEAGGAFLEGLAAYERGDLAAAAGRFVAATEANAGFVEAWVWRARSLQEDGALEAAEAAWARVVELDPADDRARFFRDRLREQLAYGRDADPEVAAAFASGVAAFEAADLATARARFEAVVAADPGSGLAWSWLGRVAYTVRDFAAAAAAYARAAELLPDDADVAWFAEDAAFRAAPEPEPEPEPVPEPDPEPEPAPAPTPEAPAEPGAAPPPDPDPTADPDVDRP
jgi:tetratricopeptide (TPR) repeat protein